MKKTQLELYVGGFVLLGLAAIVYLTVKLGAGALLGGDAYPIEAVFDNASGLNVGSSVHVAGVPVGRVEDIQVDKATFSAVVKMSVRAGLNLPTDTMASIKTTGLIGDKYISLAPGADEASLKPGERIVLTESSVDIESLIGKMAFGGLDKDKDNGKTPMP
jgi:phospholipid/cholesterol/gamma-HCH transport system substrate-binding protein